MPQFDFTGAELKKSTNVYALVDCNSFYCSCERVFKPELRNKPVGVLSNNDGCIIALTPELKDLGIAMGSPAHLHRDILDKHEVALFSSNYELYGNMSARVMGVLQYFSPDVEVYSIDEAFISLNHHPKSDLTKLGHTIRNTIYRWTGIPVGVGIGSTKTLAKLANRLSKEYGGVCSLLNVPDTKALFSQIPVTKVWGISKGFYERLKAKRISSVWDLYCADDAWLMSKFPVTLVRTANELRGVECLLISDIPKPKKHIMNSRSFGSYIEDFETLASAVTYHASRGGEEMRQLSLCACALNVFIHTNKHRADLPQYYGSTTIGFLAPTDYTPELIKAALQGLKEIWRPNYKYQKAGVMMVDLIPEGNRQRSLLNFRDMDRADRLMETLDSINGIFGKGSIKLGSEGFKNAWAMRQDHLSPRFTTRWDELLRVDT